jgi:hypothetical protein
MARYELNEPAKATVLVDSSGNAIDGTIGGHVGLNAQYHDFPFHKGWAGGTVDPQHNDLVDSSALNPGTRDFSLSLRLRFTKALGNILQKGQSGTVGGMWALKLDDGDGRVLCQYRSPGGGGAVWSNRVVDDGAWHVVTCTRTKGHVSVTVDGSTATNGSGNGDITNSMPLSLGGKSKCKAEPGFDCDYFDGQIDWLRISSTVAAVPEPYISRGKVNVRTFYPYKRDGYRDRVRYRFRAGLPAAVQGGADVKVVIRNAHNRIVRTWTFHQDAAGIQGYRIRWAGRNDHGRMVRPGTFRIHAVISDAVTSVAAPWRTIRARRGR